jgi:hypothetical protein
MNAALATVRKSQQASGTMPGDGRAFRGYSHNAADLETVRPPDATAEAYHDRSSRIGNRIIHTLYANVVI